MITVAEVKRGIKRLKELSGDDERAHSLEDSLRFQVLLAIASGSDQAQLLAKEVLKTMDVDFSRWTIERI